MDSKKSLDSKYLSRDSEYLYLEKRCRYSKFRDEKQNPKPSSSSGIGFDLDILDCPVCMELFSPRIFQCSNGHCVCQPCIAKIKNKCPTCSESIGKIRNLSLENILESLKVPCDFARMGCGEILQYKKKKLHQQNCPHKPHQCPVAQCCFNGQIESFSLHFKIYHKTKTLKIQYDQWFSASIGTREPYLLLCAEEDKFFIFHNKREELGNVLYVTALGAIKCGFQHNYSIVLNDGKDVVQLKSSVGSSFPSSAEAVEHSSIDLLVPRSFTVSKRDFSVECYICRPGKSCPSWE